MVATIRVCYFNWTLWFDSLCRIILYEDHYQSVLCHCTQKLFIFLFGNNKLFFLGNCDLLQQLNWCKKQWDNQIWFDYWRLEVNSSFCSCLVPASRSLLKAFNSAGYPLLLMCLVSQCVTAFSSAMFPWGKVLAFFLLTDAIRFTSPNMSLCPGCEKKILFHNINSVVQ